MVTLKTIKLKNFKSFGNKVSEYNFDEKMTLIHGGNAQGKTTILQAIVYGLFGKVPGFKNIELVNNINKRDMVVEVEFFVNDTKYRVVRGVKPKIFEIYKDGEKINEDSKSLGYQQMLEDEILGINLKTFMMLVSLDATMLTKSFITMSSFERKSFLEYILDIRILFFIDNIVKQRMNFIKTLITEAEFKLKTRREVLETEINHLEKIREINKQLKENKNVELQELEEKISMLQERLSKYDIAFEKIKEAEERLLESKKEYSEYNQKFTSLKSESQELQNSLFELKSLEKQYEGCIGCEKLSSLTSGKDFSQEAIDIAQKTLEKNKEILLDLKEVLTSIEEKIESDRKIVSNKQRLKNNQEELIKEISDVDKAILKVKEYKIIPEDSSKISEIEGELREIENELSSLDSKMNVFKKIQLLVSDKGIKKNIFKKYIPVFNKYLNSYMQEFELSYNIIFDEEFNVFILDNGEIRNFTTFSASERLRINLVIIFSFLRLIELRNSFRINVLMIDELLDSGLSDANFDLTLEFLKNNFSKDKEVIVISHKGNIDPEFFDKIYKIKKENGFSRMEIKE